MDLAAWRSHRQGLDGSLMGQSPAEVLKRSGWSRSVGTGNPYLALFARAGLRRAEVDAALAAVEIHELPSARGCTYVLPAEDYALGLAVGQPFRGNELKLALKLGASEEEIGSLRAVIAKALKKGPLEPDAIKKAAGDSVRNFGDEGKKKGITTTLPVALGLMQSAGEIRRVPVNGRLDQQRYKYALWNVKPKGTFSDLARLFFSWMGVAPPEEFQTFAGLGVKAAKEAMEGIERPELEGFEVPKKPQYALVGNLDNILPPPGLKDFWGHRIVDRGRLIGSWEFDEATGTIAYKVDGKPDSALKETIKKTEAFIREDLGTLR